MSLQRIHVAIPCIVMLASVAAPMGESLAAVRESRAAEATPKPHRHAAATSTISRRSRSDGSRCGVADRNTLGRRRPVHASERSISRRSPHHGAGAAVARSAVPARDRSDGGGSFSGLASYYAEPQRLATGEAYEPSALTCAHRTLPLGTRLRVSDPKSGRSVVVTVKDRGPFARGRVLDLSVGAARALGMTNRGVMLIRASVL